jgi:hypothetical protein
MPLSFPSALHAPPISFSILWPLQYWVRNTDHEAPHYEVFSTPLLLRPSYPHLYHSKERAVPWEPTVPYVLLSFPVVTNVVSHYILLFLFLQVLIVFSSFFFICQSAIYYTGHFPKNSWNWNHFDFTASLEIIPRWVWRRSKNILLAQLCCTVYLAVCA